jgi:hypothetical protein
MHGRGECLQFMLQEEPGALVWQDDDGDTILHAAAARGHAEALALLCRAPGGELEAAASGDGAGAPPFAAAAAAATLNAKGENPLNLAAVAQRSACVDLLGVFEQDFAHLADPGRSPGAGLSLAEIKKAEGNGLVKIGDWARAITCYEGAGMRFFSLYRRLRGCTDEYGRCTDRLPVGIRIEAV